MSTRLDPTIKVVTVAILTLGGIGTLHEATHSATAIELYTFTALAVAELITSTYLVVTWLEAPFTRWITK